MKSYIIFFTVLILLVWGGHSYDQYHERREKTEIYEEFKGRWKYVDKATGPVEIISFPDRVTLELKYRGKTFFKDNSSNEVGQIQWNDPVAKNWQYSGDYPIISIYNFEHYFFVEAEYWPEPVAQEERMHNTFVIDTVRKTICQIQ